MYFYVIAVAIFAQGVAVRRLQLEVHSAVLQVCIMNSFAPFSGTGRRLNELEVVAGQVEATPATEVVDVDSYADSVDSPIPSFRDRLLDDHAGISAADYINRVVAFGLVASNWVR